MQPAAAKPPIARLTGAFVLAALLSLLVTGSAIAAQRTVRDPKFDSAYLSRHGRLDITKSTADRKLTAVRHSVTTKAKVRPARPAERPAILINTRGGRRSSYEYIVYGSTVFSVPKKGRPQPVAGATLTASDRTWRYSFDLADVPDLGAGYGWAAITQKPGGKVADVAPDNGYVKSP